MEASLLYYPPQMEQDCSQWTCNICGNVGMTDGLDGYYYCMRWNSQADNIDEDFVEKSQGGAFYLASHTRHARQPVTPAQPISQYDPKSQQFGSYLSQEHRDHDHNQDGLRSNSQADNIIDTGVADEDFIEMGSQGGALHARPPVIPTQPVSRYDLKSQQFWSHLSRERRDHDENQDEIGKGAGLDGVGRKKSQ